MKDISEVVKENQNLIYKIASKYSTYYNIEDLFQVGAIGLIKAYKNYKEDSNAKFSTYAHKYIFGEIIEFIKNDRTIKVGSDTLKLYKSYEKTKEYLTNRNGVIPNISEISEFMGVPVRTLEEAVERSMFTLSIDNALNEDEFTLEKVIGVDNRNTIDNLIDLRRELENLSGYERELIRLRYFEDYTQSETAEFLGKSQVQVSRSEKLILKKIETKIH